MSPSSTTSTILIVDHDPATLSMKRRLLSRQSYRIIEAENGADALMLATAELPDLVLLDANLPDIDTFDACRRLKTQSETKFVKILQTSAARMNGPDRMKGLEMGADTYLVEPAEEELIGTVRALLKLAKQERDNIRLAEKLSRAERQLSAATEAVHCAVWDWDIATDRVEWTGGLERWAGLPSGTFGETMQDFLNLLHPDDRPRVRQKLEQAMAGRAIDYADEYRFRHPNGNLHYLHAGGRFHYDGQGTAVRMTGIVQDITERKRAEVAVRESEERFAKAFRTSPHPIGITEVTTGRCIEVNDACLQLFGFSREEVIGSTTLMLGIWPNQEDRARLVGQVKAGEPIRNLELTFKTRSGDFRHILVSSDLVELNGTLCLITVGNDITNRKQAEEKLRESEERFRTMAEAVPSFLFETDAEGWNTWTSEGWCRFTGQTSEQVAGHGWAEALHPDDRLANIDQWLRCMKDGVPFEAQQRLRRADGSYAWVIARALPVFGDQGTIRCWVGSVTDVDAIVRAEEGQARLAAIVQSTSDAIIGKDAQGIITSWNRGAEALLGYTEAEAIGRPVTMLFPSDRASEEPAILDRLKKGESIRQYETVRRRKDGRDIHVALTISPIMDKQGRIIGASKILRDITVRKHAEEQLRENHRFISEMTSVLPGVLYIFDLQEQKNVYVNRTTGSVLGYSEEEVHALGKDFIPTILHPDDALRLLQHYESFKDLKDGVTVQVEYRFRHRDGSYRWFLSRDVVWQRSSNGHVRQILGMATDITERKQVEQQLRDSEAQLQAAMSAGAVGTWMWDIVNDSVVANPSFARIFGLDPDHAQRGLPVKAFLAAIHQEDRPRVETAIAEALKSGGKYEEEYRVRNTEKQWRWVVARGRVEYDARHKPVRFPGTLIDITERKHAEESLRESEARFRNVFEYAGTGIAIAELDGSLVQCNPAYCAMLGYAEDELRCRRFPELIHPEDRAGNVAGIERLIAGELPYFEVENRYVGENGEPVWAHKFVSLLRDHAGEPKYLVALVTNVTNRRKDEHELREVQGQLQRWNIELEQAVNEKTVELRQSQGRLRALASELNLAEQRERKRIATELHDHLQQTLVLGKLTMGQGKRLAAAMPACLNVMKKADDIFSEALTYTRTLVAELSPPVLRDQGLAAGLKWLGGYMQKYHLTVTVTVPEAMELRIPEDQVVLLFQSVRELLMNAWKHAGTGKAAVVLTYTDDQLRITVSDKGAGFDLAVAASAKPTDGGVSSKFGLFSIEERMHSLGGSLELKSAKGKGTTATLVLPLARHRETEVKVQAESQERSLSSILQPTASRIRVLLVDDHIMMRQGLRAVLDEYPEVELVGEAGNGEEAVQLVDQQRPTVVVMDINMPKMDGIEATERIKSHHPETIIIGLSVNAAKENEEAMRRAGAVRLMTKEAAMEELYGAIQGAVKREGETRYG